MRTKMFWSRLAEFEERSKTFFEENKDLDIKFINTCLGQGSEAVLVLIFYDEKTPAENVSRLDE